MHENHNQVDNADKKTALGRYCVCLVAFISSQATDPHLYFQHKLTADISRARDLEDMISLLVYLVDWIDSADLQSMQMTRLDKMLTAEELPSFALMRTPTYRELGQILATGQIATEPDYRLVRNSILETSEISSRDRILGECLVTAYESRE